jgi:hypothetical protein
MLQDFSNRLILKKFDGRGERIRTSGLYVPNVALYQAKLHPDYRQSNTFWLLQKHIILAKNL